MDTPWPISNTRRMTNAVPFRPALAAVLALLTIVVTFTKSTPASAQQPIRASEAFKQLTGLVGTWDVTERDNPNTKEVANYSLTGGGSVLAEDLRAPDGTANAMGHMYTTYYMDKDQLVLTHFCGAGNQPRMRAKAVADGGTRIVFEMYDITNLATPESFHSESLEVIFLSRVRVDLVYHGTRGPSPGAKSEQVFQLTRRTAAL